MRRPVMAANRAPVEATAPLPVDPYNEFLSDNGKLQSRAKPVMDEVGTVAHMREAVAACRAASITVFYVPHNRAEPFDFSQWAHPTPYQPGGHRMQLFAEGSWGAEWHPDFQPRPADVLIKEHRGSSGFADSSDLCSCHRDDR